MSKYTYNKPAGVYPEKLLRYSCDVAECYRLATWKQISGPDHEQELRWLCQVHKSLLPEGATHAELIQLSLPVVQALAEANPSYIAAQNAVRELEREAKAREKSRRHSRKHAVRNGMTKSRRSASGPRCPTKRELR